MTTPLKKADDDPAAVTGDIVRLAADIGCEAFLLPQGEAQREAVIDLIERLADRLGTDVRLIPRSAQAPPPAAAGPRRFVLTARDTEILRAVARYRYLRTGQIHRLLFAPAGAQMARRRLRHLASDSCRYLGKAEFVLQTEGAPYEIAYFLAPPGIRYLAELGESPPEYALERQGRVRHRFLEHALALSEFRLKLELALRALPALSLRRFVADFEVKEHMKAAAGKERFKLYYAFPSGPARRAVVYPDAMAIIAAGEEADAEQRLFFLEIDQGTESHAVIREKVFAYHLYREAGVFRKFGDFNRFRVLFQTHSEKRLRLLRETLAEVKGGELVWLAAAPAINEETILTGAVWTDIKGQQRSIAHPA